MTRGPRRAPATRATVNHRTVIYHRDGFGQRQPRDCGIAGRLGYDARMTLRKRTWWIGLFALVVFAACATVPYTKRSQLIVMPSSEELALGADAYRQVLAKEPISHDPALVGPVRDVGKRIARVAERPNYKWELTVIQKDIANAFALPGGKVAVYTGLFPIAKDTVGLAAVMGHEIGHALARHGAERMSQGVLVDAVATGAAIALGSQAPALWRRFEAAEKERPPEFLSTHPNPGTRQQDIATWLPEASRYLPANGKVTAVPLPVVKAGH
jgi:predicted Zn-dependent protease